MVEHLDFISAPTETTSVFLVVVEGGSELLRQLVFFLSEKHSDISRVVD